MVWGTRVLFVAAGVLLGAGATAKVYQDASFNGNYRESVETKIDSPLSATALHDYSLSEMTDPYYKRLLELRKSTLLSTTNYRDYDRDGELDSVDYTPGIFLHFFNDRSESYHLLEDGSISCSVGYNFTDSFRDTVTYPSEEEKRDYFDGSREEFKVQMARFRQ